MLSKNGRICRYDPHIFCIYAHKKRPIVHMRSPQYPHMRKVRWNSINNHEVVSYSFPFPPDSWFISVIKANRETIKICMPSFRVKSGRSMLGVCMYAHKFQSWKSDLSKVFILQKLDRQHLVVVGTNGVIKTEHVHACRNYIFVCTILVKLKPLIPNRSEAQKV